MALIMILAMLDPSMFDGYQQHLTLHNIHYGNGSSYRRLSLIDWALKLGDLKTVLTLVEYGADFNVPKNNQSIFNAVLNYIDQELTTGLAVLQALINKGYNINDRDTGINGLACAITRRFDGEVIQSINDVLNFLLKNGADVNQDIFNGEMRTTPLMYAIGFNNVAAIKFLINAGADKNKTGIMNGRRPIPESPLAFAMRVQNELKLSPEIIQILQQN